MKEIERPKQPFLSKEEEQAASLWEIYDALEDAQALASNLIDIENSLLICKVLKKLPKGIREKIINEVMFLHTVTWGTVMCLHLQKSLNEKEIKEKEAEFKKAIILLNFKGVRKEENKMSTIAHEIAHIILGHHEIEGSTDKYKERQADDLTEKWGFKRNYTSYKVFER